MIDPYKMVVVNLISLLLVVSGILFYKFIFPKKKINLFILLMLISIIPTISIFRTGVYESGDFVINVIKTMSLYSAYSDGIFFPKWAESLNATYGYPLFMFTYPLPYATASLFHFLGFSFINSIKILLIGSLILSSVSMYIWVKDELGKFAGFVSGIFYLFAPYHLIDAHFRVDIGETLSFVFMPLTLYGAKKIIEVSKFKYIIFEGFAISGLILSHQAISLSFMPFLFIYGLFTYLHLKKRRRKKIYLFFISLILGLSLSAFYWIPAVFEGVYTKREVFSGISFPSLWEFFFSPWRFGLLFQGPMGELSFLIGYAQWIVIFISLYLVYVNKQSISSKLFRIATLFLISFVIIFLMMQSFSKPLWSIIPLINNFQFSFRLLALEVLFTAFLAGILAKYLRSKKLIYLLCIFAIFSTMLNWGNRRTIPQITDSIIAKDLPLSTAKGEALQPAFPIWVDTKNFTMSVIPNSHLEILEGNGTISEKHRNSILHTYHLDAKTNIYLKENTLYFPGWKIYANNKPINIQYQNPKYPGVITFHLPKGSYEIKTAFEDTPIVSFANSITILTFILIMIVLLRKILNRLRFNYYVVNFPSIFK